MTQQSRSILLLSDYFAGADLNFSLNPTYPFVTLVTSPTILTYTHFKYLMTHSARFAYSNSGIQIYIGVDDHFYVHALNLSTTDYI